MTIVASPFGRDMSATDRIRTGTMVTGGILLGEAAYRRLITTRGELEYDPSYGLNLAERLGEEMSDDDIAALPDEIVGELMKDERLERVEITMTRLGDVPLKLRLDIRGFAKEGEGFAMALESSEVTTELLELEAT